MGKHLGWRVYEKAGEWVGAIREGDGYRTRGFTGEREATRWAQDEAAKSRARAAWESAPGRVMTAAAMADYLAALEARGRSPSHLVNVRATLTELAIEVPRLDSDDAQRALQRWWATLAKRSHGGHGAQGERMSPATRNRKLTEARALCRWLIRQDRLSSDPTRRLERLAVDSYLRPQFSLDELRTIVRATGDPQWLRLCLLVYLGMRDGEVDLIRWSDVDESGKVIALRLRAGTTIKRRRERLVPIPDELLAILTERRDKPEVPVLSPTKYNRHLLFARALERLGIPLDGRSPHSLRHTYAGVMTATGVPGPLLSAWLGHTSAATTMLYTKLAARYSAGVEGWPRGQMRLMAQPLPVTA